MKYQTINAGDHFGRLETFVMSKTGKFDISKKRDSKKRCF